MTDLLTYQEYRDTWIANCKNPYRALRGTTGVQHHKNYMEYVKHWKSIPRWGDRVVVLLGDSEIARGVLSHAPWSGHHGIILDGNLTGAKVSQRVSLYNFDHERNHTFHSDLYKLSRTIIFPPVFRLIKEN